MFLGVRVECIRAGECGELVFGLSLCLDERKGSGRGKELYWPLWLLGWGDDVSAV
jgi:hypothetical protein